MNTTKNQIEFNAVTGFGRIFDYDAQTGEYTLKSEYHSDDIYLITATAKDATTNPKITEGLLYMWTRGKFVCSGDSIEDVSKQFIPYYYYDDGQYVMKNEGIAAIDALNSDARTDLTGQGIIVGYGDQTKMAAVRYDSIGVAVANSSMGDGEPEVMSMITLAPQISGDTPSEIKIESILNGSTFKSAQNVLGDSISIHVVTEDEEKVGMVEYGYLNSPINWAQRGDFMIHIVDMNNKYADSWYAVRNGGVGEENTPAYLATEDFVLQHAGGGSIDDEKVSTTTTWSSEKISEELSKSDRIRYYSTKQEWIDDVDRAIPCIVYIKESDKIIWDDGNVKIPYVWNFSDSKFSSLGTVTTKTTIDSLTIIPSLQINAYRQTIDDEQFTSRAYFETSGSTSAKALSFELTGNDDVQIYFQTANNRNFRLVKENGDVIKTFTGNTAQSQTFHYSGEPCTAFLYMASGSGYVYAIKLNDN